MIPGGNMGLPKGMKNSEKVTNHMGKYMFFFEWGEGGGGHTALEALGEAQPLKISFLLS